jgi:hypothetical protein
LKIAEDVLMSIKEDLLKSISGDLDRRNEERDMRPLVEVWPDDFDMWVASHEHKDRSVICNTPEFENTAFCGLGYH